MLIKSPMNDEHRAQESTLYPPPNTSEGAEQFAQVVMNIASNELQKYGQVSPAAFIITACNPETLKEEVETLADGSEVSKLHIIVVMAENFDEAGKNRFADTLRKSAEVLHAIGVAFVSEVWMVSGDSKESLDELEKSKTPLEFVPGRKECIMVTLEHRAFKQTRVWMAPILRDGSCPRAGEFAEPYADADKTQGRFTNLLPITN
jgi:hypothetical protein